MRKRYRVMLLASLVAALVVPVGFALSLESPSASARSRAQAVVTRQAAFAAKVSPAAAPPLVIATTAASPAGLSSIPEAAKFLVVGTVLFGLAAFVRKAV